MVEELDERARHNRFGRQHVQRSTEMRQQVPT
jgi:hypothetical protein